jgi:formate C-acetyltransferase
MVEQSLKAYNATIDDDLKKHFTEFRKTHNQGVFDVYTPEIRAARHSGLITGLPDAYGRGRIIGDYRRVALYGVDYLIKAKKEDYSNLTGLMLNDLIQLREEVAEQIKALEKLKQLANSYDYDISNPA